MIKRKNYEIQIICAFIICLVFSIFALLLVISSVKSYRKISNNVKQNNEIRSGILYTANKIRANDNEDAIGINEFDDTKVLSVYDNSQEQNMVTYIYWNDGYLMEQYCYCGNDFNADNGNRIVALKSFDINEDNGEFIISVSSENGFDISMKVTPQSTIRTEKE